MLNLRRILVPIDVSNGLPWLMTWRVLLPSTTLFTRREIHRRLLFFKAATLKARDTSASSTPMTETSYLRIARYLVAIVAVAFGLLTIWSGGAVLFGGEEARQAVGDFVPFVVWSNFVAGFFYVVAGVGLWQGGEWARWVAVAIAGGVAGTYFAFGLHVLQGGPYEIIPSPKDRCASESLSQNGRPSRGAPRDPFVPKLFQQVHNILGIWYKDGCGNGRSYGHVDRDCCVCLPVVRLAKGCLSDKTAIPIAK